jgi:hypothetical protein
MNPRRLIASVVVACFAFTASTATFAWNRGGHLTTGAIAYKELAATNPAVLARIEAIMKSHPTPSLTLDRAKEEPGDQEKTERLLMEMATWSDEVRPPSGFSKEFHRDTRHYIHLPYVPEGSQVKPATLVEKDRLFEAMRRNADIVASKESTDAEKAVALCWLFHLIGDMHQPIHTTALFNEEFPDGDKNANAIKIRVKPDSREINLHQFWDGAVLGSSDPKAARNQLVNLRSAFPKTDLAALKDRPFTDTSWFEIWGRQESAKLAIESAYFNGKLLTFEKTEGAYQLTPGYVAQAKATADKLAALAGYRIAEVMVKLLITPSDGSKAIANQK